MSIYLLLQKMSLEIFYYSRKFLKQEFLIKTEQEISDDIFGL